MSNSYLNNYVLAVDRPIPEMKKTFDEEISFFKDQVSKNSLVLDVGCGIGRPASELAKFVKEIKAIDNNPKMIELARKRCKQQSNISLDLGDALELKFEDSQFDLVYSTYNTIGSIHEGKYQSFIEEMVRVVRSKGKVVNITWKEGKGTTNILKKYYPSIGIKILKIDESKSITDQGIFKRFTKDELINYYKKAKLTSIKCVDIGPAWMAIIGEKP